MAVSLGVYVCHVLLLLLICAADAGSPVSGISAPRELVEVWPLFSLATHPYDSTGEVIEIRRSPLYPNDDYLAYPFCSFTNVCLTPSSIRFRWHDEAIYKKYAQEVKECKNPNRARKNTRYDLCYCFYSPELEADVLPFHLIHADPVDLSITLTLSATSATGTAAAAAANSPSLTPYSSTTDQAGLRPGTPLRTPATAGMVEGASFPAYDTFKDFLPVYRKNQYTPPSPPAHVSPPLPLSPSMTPLIFPGHYWSVHKYVRQHQFGHWAQRWLLSSSIFQHSQALPLPPVDAFVMQDTDAPFTPMEMAIFNLSALSLLTNQRHNFENMLVPTYETAQGAWPNQLLSASDLDSRSKAGNYTCMERVSYVKGFGIFSSNNHDTMAFRAVAYKQYGLKGLAHRCPPRHITLLTRDNRKILNAAEIVDWIQSTYGKTVELTQIGADSTPREQIELFARSGLLIASHSSQMVNVMFSHPRAALVEIAPEFYNSDFSEYAHGMGVYFQYALGGSVPGQVIDESMNKCVERLKQCKGDSYCILNKRFENVCKRRITCCKYADGFLADLDTVKQAVKRALAHLNWACGETW